MRVCVILEKPLRGQDGSGRAITIRGYYKNFAVTAKSATDARIIVSRTVQDGSIDWTDSEVEEGDVATISLKVAFPCNHPDTPGIWHASGRVLFPE